MRIVKLEEYCGVVGLVPRQSHVLRDGLASRVLDVENARFPITGVRISGDNNVGAVDGAGHGARRHAVRPVGRHSLVRGSCEERIVVRLLRGDGAGVHRKVHDKLILDAGGLDGFIYADAAICRLDKAIVAQLVRFNSLARLMRCVIAPAYDLPAVIPRSTRDKRHSKQRDKANGQDRPRHHLFALDISTRHHTVSIRPPPYKQLFLGLI